MSKQYYLCLDVGGTEIKVNLLNQQKEVYFPGNKSYPARSDEDQISILKNFSEIFGEFLQLIRVEKAQLLGVGIAFPGPFDYAKGICLMQGLRKYDAIYQVDLRQQISGWLEEHHFPVTTPVHFQNDAIAFSIGEYCYGAAQQAMKAIFLTIGTGCGSTFIEKGQIVKGQYGLNDSGMIYGDPFLERTIDDYLSARGLQALADEMGLPGMDGLLLAQLASAGHEPAQQVFHEFGYMVGSALQGYVKQFQPNCVVFGGQISKSMEWMKAGILTALMESTSEQFMPEIRVSKNGTLSTFKGLMIT
ncbi:ROK family protein [Sporosarcina sp. YIM B06819]|uniref:ROK family protein n=1 Tax=Sporosarcina sp. YIM B06819 TaxID=3081769 RepID=UPI00298C6AC4|nr:ROK family protein [Sporosarcina sp. YIM B06819]